MLSIIGYEYAAMIEPDWRQVTFLELALRRLPQEFHGYRLVQISDIHMDSWMTAERLSTVIKEVNGLGADMVAITGDFISEEPEKNAAILAEELTKISAKDGSVAVLGNHDHWTNPHEIRMALKKSGVINVSNSVHTIFRGASQLHFAGVDDIWENQDRLDLVLEMLPEEGCAILLAHEPDFADTSAATGR
ncbi:MAG: metallophosphoesterase, partial [Anaerolineae bacterium]|nr:metallophosphoesterase [Anaerolineae bacterium]